jgi:predicted RNase H-related nuclease YkuK (DUF458 family)
MLAKRTIIGFIVGSVIIAIGGYSLILHIGTDAQARGTVNKADFVTVVCVHNIDINGIGHGARIFYWKDKGVPFHSLWEKLYGETERSLRVAVQIEEEFGEEFRNRILVHVDANPNPLFKSSKHVQQLAGMVVGYGFKHVLKPYAYVASHCADHIVKGKN